MNLLTLGFLHRVRTVAPYALRAAIGWGMFWMHGLKKLYPNGDWRAAWASSGSRPVLLYAVAWESL